MYTKRIPWNEQEGKILKEYASTKTWQQIADMLGRTRGAVQHRADLLGLIRYHRAAWSDSDQQKLKDVYQSSTNKELLNLFPQRSIQGIQTKARQIGLAKDWSDAAHFLSYSHLSQTDLAYLAGIIDGEGHITIISARKGKLFVPVIGVANSSPEITGFLETVPFYWKAEEPEVKQNGRIIKQRRPIYRYRIVGMRILSLLKVLSPYLRAKKQQCMIVMQYIKSRRNRGPYSLEELELVRKIRMVNSRKYSEKGGVK